MVSDDCPGVSKEIEIPMNAAETVDERLPEREGKANLNEDVFFKLVGNEMVECPFGYDARCLAAWMSFIDGNTKVVDVVIPGSHDSGTYSMRDYSDCHAQTQEYNLTAQLLFGMRYLDLRCKLKEGQVIINHGPVTGRTLSNILNQITAFTNAVPGELVLLDFQELNDNCERQAADLIARHIPANQIVPADKVNTSLTLGDVRGGGYRFIIFWDKEDYCGKDYLTPRDRLWSPYDENVYKSPTSNIPPYLDQKCQEWKNSHSNQFLVSQVISTPFISTPRIIENRDGHILNDWVIMQRANSNVNIIMRDFVNLYPALIYHIVALNYDRGLIDAKYKSLFALMHAAKYEGRTLNSECFENGEKNYTSSKLFIDDRFKVDWGLNKKQSHTWKISCPDGYSVSWFRITSNWSDRTNGTCTISRGGVLNKEMEVYVESEYMRGCDWSISVEIAPFIPDNFFGSY